MYWIIKRISVTWVCNVLSIAETFCWFNNQIQNLKIVHKNAPSLCYSCYTPSWAIMETWREYGSQMFPVCWFFYCFGCIIGPLIIWFSKLVILLSPLFFNFMSIWYQKHWPSSVHKVHFKSLVFRSRSCNMTLRLWRHFVVHKTDWRLKTSLFLFLSLKLKVVKMWNFYYIFLRVGKYIDKLWNLHKCTF